MSLDRDRRDSMVLFARSDIDDAGSRGEKTHDSRRDETDDETDLR